MRHRKISKTNREKTNNTRFDTSSFKKGAKHYGWAMHHLHPDIFPPSRMPSQYPIKTHLIQPKTKENLVATGGNLAIFFCPMVAAWEKIRLGGVESNIDTAFSSDSYVWLAHSSKNTMSASGSTIYAYNTAYDRFNNVSTWANTLIGVPGAEHLKKLKLVAARLKLTYFGKEDEISGLFKIGMGFKQFNNSMFFENIKLSDIDDFPSTHTQTAKEPVIVTHTITDMDYMEFGPYTPYKVIPFFFIIGEGLPINGNFHLEIVRTIEGVVMPSMTEFAAPQTPTHQASAAEQAEMVKNFSDGLNKNSSLTDEQKKEFIDQFTTALSNSGREIKGITKPVLDAFKFAGETIEEGKNLVDIVKMLLKPITR